MQWLWLLSVLLHFERGGIHSYHSFSCFDMILLYGLMLLAALSHYATGLLFLDVIERIPFFSGLCYDTTNITYKYHRDIEVLALAGSSWQAASERC